MRLKTYTAATMKEAMRLARAELGEQAVIVATRERRRPAPEVRITAAVEDEPDLAAAPAAAAERAGPARDAPDGPVAEALAAHGAPPRVVTRLEGTARALSTNDPVMALAAALDHGFRFAPLPERAASRPIMLVGPPGVGKTVTVAKLAARAVMQRRPVRVITTDTHRAGGVEQLRAFTRLMEADLVTADGPPALGEALGRCRLGDLVFIDTAGVNPFDELALGELEALVAAAAAEPVLVLNAGVDPVDAAELAMAFASLGTARLVITRIDMARRLGGILAAADAGRLKFSNASISAHVGQGLTAVNPVSLARLLMPGADAEAPEPSLKEGVS